MRYFAKSIKNFYNICTFLDYKNCFDRNTNSYAYDNFFFISFSLLQIILKSYLPPHTYTFK